MHSTQGEAWCHRTGHGEEQTLSDKETEVKDWGGSDKGRTEVLLLTFRLNSQDKVKSHPHGTG